MKIEKTRNFGRITAINGRYRNASGTSECTTLKLDGWRNIGFGKYHWINRPRQRYDYEMALYHAYHDMLNDLSWSQYEELKPEIEKIEETLKKMENYDWKN